MRGQVVARPVHRPERTSHVLQALAADLEHLLGPAEVLQPVLTEVSQRDAGRDVLAERESSRSRHEHLPAVADRHQSRDPIYRRPEEVVISSCALTRVDRHSHANGHGCRPQLLLQRQLSRGRGANAIGRGGEHGAERVTDRLEDDATAFFDGASQ